MEGVGPGASVKALRAPGWWHLHLHLECLLQRLWLGSPVGEPVAVRSADRAPLLTELELTLKPSTELRINMGIGVILGGLDVLHVILAGGSCVDGEERHTTGWARTKEKKSLIHDLAGLIVLNLRRR